MFSGLFFVSAICAHENHKRPMILFRIISFLYPRPVRLIYLPRPAPRLARGWRSGSAPIHANPKKNIP